MENENIIKSKYLPYHDNHHLRIAPDTELIDYILYQIKLLVK